MNVELEKLDDADLSQMLWEKEVEIRRLKKTIVVLINKLEAVQQVNGKKGTEDVCSPGKGNSDGVVDLEGHRSSSGEREKRSN